MFGGVDIHLIRSVDHFTCDRVEADDFFDLIAKKTDADGFFFTVRRQHLERVAADAEDTGLDLEVIALILHIDKLAQEGVAPVDGAFLDVQHVRAVGVGVTQTIYG